MLYRYFVSVRYCLTIALFMTVTACLSPYSQSSEVTAKPFEASAALQLARSPVIVEKLRAGPGDNWTHRVDQAMGRDDIFGFGLVLSNVAIDDNADFVLSVKGPQGAEVQYTAEDIRKGLNDINRFDTDVIYDDQAIVTVRNLTVDDGFSFTIMALSILPGAPTEQEREELRSNIDGLWQSFAVILQPEPQLVEASRAIAALHIKQSSTKQKYCTGFLIAKDLVITNYHCMALSNSFERTKNQRGRGVVLCDDITLHFDYLKRDDLIPATRKAVSTKCRKVLTWSRYRARSIQERPLLDFAILQVDTAHVHGETQRTPLKFAQSARGLNDEHYILGHPQNWPLTLSGPCTANKQRDQKRYGKNRFQYGCSTLGGSSGSPLLNADFEVVGLHFGSNDSREGDDAFTIEFDANERPFNAAVPIEEILDRSDVAVLLRERGVSW